ncbi:hypothetical protein NFHSH190041_32180 [Shewanella sp. NFH-SH190041]|uniref:hypothetical protein n=1 Tax=Shewanella sp. NFH-SH190041 TaxID=2950245 RepID=UPI0021C47290|nr:hypothetical protein [Shewanella sp. NFH-SH190041]BDM65766.1 hypothetical protein NFHSH190041_32180 [Shewanella sp. NFH-SH190041]
MNNKWVCWGLVSFLFMVGPLQADDSNWQFNAYLNQGWAYVDDSHFIVGNNRSSSELTEATATAFWRPSASWRMAGSLTFRQWGNLAEPAVGLDYLFAEYHWQLPVGHMGLRAGRMKNEVGFYSSSRDMSFTRPGILLPQSIYADYFRDAQLHIDGADLFGVAQVGNGVLTWHLMGGATTKTDNLTRNIFGGFQLGHFDAKDFYAADIEYQDDALRLGATYYHAGLDYHAGGPFVDGEIFLHAWVLSAQYRWRWFELTAEYLVGERHTQGVYLAPEAGESDEKNRGYYLEGRWLLPHRTELYLRYDDYADNDRDPDGKRYALTTGKPDYFAFARDWTFGGRWQINENWQLAMEYHRVHGAAWVAPVLTRNPALQPSHWSMLALQLSYRFQW